VKKIVILLLLLAICYQSNAQTRNESNALTRNENFEEGTLYWQMSSNFRVDSNRNKCNSWPKYATTSDINNMPRTWLNDSLEQIIVDKGEMSYLGWEDEKKTLQLMFYDAATIIGKSSGDEKIEVYIRNLATNKTTVLYTNTYTESTPYKAHYLYMPDSITGKNFVLGFKVHSGSTPSIIKIDDVVLQRLYRMAHLIGCGTQYIDDRKKIKKK
jgi:hypothetical protein